MSWRTGSAFTPLSAAGGGAITVTTTTAIAAGERAILVVFRVQAATGTAAGNPVVSTLGGNAFTTLDILENFLAPFYGGQSYHSFVAPSLIASGATFTVTPGHVNQKVAAMLLVQADPHATQAPYTRLINGQAADLSGGQWPRMEWKGMDWDKRLLIAVGASQNNSAASPWSQVFAGSSTPLAFAGFTEVLDANPFSYIFEIAVREQDSTEGEVSAYVAGTASGGFFTSNSSGQQQGVITLVRAGAVQPTLGPDVFEYIDTPSRNLPGSGSRQAVGQLWPQ